MSFISYIQ